MNENSIIYIVDDDRSMRMLLQATFKEGYAVETFDSSEACLERLQAQLPDLFMLDVGLPGLNGFDLCRSIKQRPESGDIPIIFVSGRENLESRLQGYDAGGEDFVTKPFDINILRRKATVAIQRRMQLRGIQEATFRIVREAGKDGTLVEFLRKAVRATRFEALGKLLIETVGELGVRCNIQIRTREEILSLTPDGVPSELELSILQQAVTLGREFRFSRRLVINQQLITLLVLNMPADEEHARRLTYDLNVLAESAEAIAENLELRRDSTLNAEAIMLASAKHFQAMEELQSAYRKQQANTRVLLQQLIDEVERTYVHLGLTDRQEDVVSTTLRNNAEIILELFEQNTFEQKLSEILESLHPRQHDDADIWF